MGDLLELEPHVLRYWAFEFDVLHPRKNRAGRRVYTADDITVVRRIQCLLQEKKYTIAGAKQVIARQHDQVISEQTLREQLTEMWAFSLVFRIRSASL